MSSFQNSLKIKNRALQHVGSKQLASETEVSKAATEVNACYDNLREAELQRNTWVFAVRKTVLRPVDTTTVTFTFPTFSASASYARGSIVLFNNLVYHANQLIAASVVTPDVNIGPWTVYFGSVTAQPYDPKTAYYAGEIVYDLATTTAYLSLVSSNAVVPAAGAPAYDATITYRIGDTVTSSATIYQSTIDLNLNHTPTGTGDWIVVPGAQVNQQVGQNWLKLTSTTLNALNISYPLGSGPASQSATRNVFILPNGWLREAPQDPKAGSNSYLGVGSNLGYNDWTYENGVIVSRDFGPIVYRFVANMTQVSRFDTMFCEGLACRIALEVCEVLTQSTAKMQGIAGEYKTFMGEARDLNGIESGSVEPAEDDYLTCRI